MLSDQHRSIEDRDKLNQTHNESISQKVFKIRDDVEHIVGIWPLGR